MKQFQKQEKTTYKAHKTQILQINHKWALKTKLTHTQTLNQEQSLTLGQRTPTKQERQKQSKVTLITTEENKHTPNKIQSLDRNNTENKNIEQSPITWTLPKPIQKTRTQKTDIDNKENEFLWTFAKIIYKIVTNIMNNIKEEKTIITIITGTFINIGPLIKDLLEYINGWNNFMESKTNIKQRNRIKIFSIQRKPRHNSIMRNMAKRKRQTQNSECWYNKKG